MPWGKAICNCLQEEFSNIGGDGRVPGRVEIDDLSFVGLSAVGGLVVGRLQFLLKEKTVSDTKSPTKTESLFFS